ncbi:2,3-diphosphoglycerate-dependent phosphoglycerate mutase [Bacillus songklensis]|uniref:2,3-bisphosphoglycerate-dependent phosphoglycerate mutase n=1 Tax=Bacillus songklensis TaxID=1069116 RepID=A0ABV8B6H7_9BACI
MKKLVFIRHGQSLYNLENRFTGWQDIDLTDNGLNEAREAGMVLKKHGYIFDVAHTSLLKRAIRTLWIILHEMDLMWIPVQKSWRLNERHYGALEGMNKDQIMARFGEEQVNLWRRSTNERPPAISLKDHQHVLSDPKYQDLNDIDIPFTESLKDTEERVLVYWHGQIVPSLKQNRRMLVSAHGNTLRALVKYLDNLPDDGVMSLNIPNGIPLIYELNDDLKPIRHYYLCEDGEIPEGTIPQHMDLDDPENCEWIG